METIQHWTAWGLDTLHWAMGGDIDWKSVLLVAVSPIFMIAFAIEYQVMRGRGKRPQYDWGEALLNFSLGGLYQIADLAMHIVIVGAVSMFIYHHRLFDIPVNVWTIIPIMFAVEFCYYWFHRASHRIRWFWSAHVVHHSSARMDFSTAMRQSILYPLTGWWIFFLPLVWLGVPPGIVFLLYGVDLAYQFFVHTESVGKLPRWIEYVFDTPSNHRVHHGRNPEYIDQNYGGMIILFDRWFGTYVEEKQTPEYGIVTPAHMKGEEASDLRNPLTVNLHEFVAMWRDVLRPGPLLDRIGHLWRPPDWRRRKKPQPESEPAE